MGEQSINLRIIVENPIYGILYGLQKGNGNSYETVHKQMPGSSDLQFDIALPVKKNPKGGVVLYGPFVQGTPKARFLYLDIGTYAGQENAAHSGRLKVPLPDVTQDLFQAALDGQFLLTKIAGTKSKDGSPTMGTVKPFDGWRITR